MIEEFLNIVVAAFNILNLSLAKLVLTVLALSEIEKPAGEFLSGNATKLEAALRKRPYQNIMN